MEGFCRARFPWSQSFETKGFGEISKVLSRRFLHRGQVAWKVSGSSKVSKVSIDSEVSVDSRRFLSFGKVPGSESFEAKAQGSEGFENLKALKVLS